jgi:NADPH:quinone reductase-like Zn-dependent oxidoreductase
METPTQMSLGTRKPYEGADLMPAAVRFDNYGGPDVLQVVDVPRPTPGPGQVVVRVKAAGINPGEGKIRDGALHERWPATFPSGQGSDLAGVIEELSEPTNGFSVGDEVIGFTHDRSSQAELVAVDADHLTYRPAEVPWDVAGSLFVVGTTAYAVVRAVSAGPGDTVVVSGAAGGVGSLTVQLAKRAGATVLGLASEPNHEWLRDHGVIPVTYGEGVAERLNVAANGPIDAFIDLVGGDYVQIALDLGVKPDRIDTIANFQAKARYGVKIEGNNDAASADVLAQLAALIADGQLEMPIAQVFPLAQVADAYRELELGHTRGKIVLTL